MEGFSVSSGLQEMGLKHPEKVFGGRFNDWAAAVRYFDLGEITGEMEFPSGQVRQGGRTEKEVREEAKLICKQFKKGPKDFGRLTAEKGSVFGALGAMIFPENADLAEELAVEMRFAVGKPPGNNVREYVQEEEAVFQKMPVITGENCLLAASLRKMTERRYKQEGDRFVGYIARQVIDWERDNEDGEVNLSDRFIAWLNYSSLSQYLRGTASGIDITLDADKNWHLLAKNPIKRQFSCPQEWNFDQESGYWLSKDKGMFKIEGNQLITQGVSPQDFIRIARAVRPAVEEDEIDLDLLLEGTEEPQQADDGKARPVSELLPGEMPPAPEEEEIPAWLKAIRASQPAAAVVAAVPPPAEEPDGQEKIPDWLAKLEAEAEAPAEEKKPQPPKRKLRKSF